MKTDEPITAWEAPIRLGHVDVPEFPTIALPGWLRDFVLAEATATQTPPDLSALLALSACAFACSKRAVVRVKEGHEEPLNLYTVTALPPANRKSAVFRDVAAPLVAAEAEEAERRGPEIAEAESRYRVDQEALRQLESKAARNPGAKSAPLRDEAAKLARELSIQSPPSAPRYVVEDCSPERLATILCAQNGRIAALAPEGDVFDLMAGRYSANGAANFGVFLKGHAGDDLRVDRVGRAAEYVRAPALTIGLAVQPEVIRGLMQKQGFHGRGLLGRFLYAMPKSLLGRRKVDAPGVPAAIREAYAAGIAALLSLPVVDDDHGTLVPAVLTLEPDALMALREFERSTEPRLGEFGDLGSMSDWAGKLVGAVVRIVGILRLAGDPDISTSRSLRIDRSTMEQAIRIGHYLIPHARAAYGEMGGDPVVGEAVHLLDWISRHGHPSITKRDAFNATRGRFKRVSSMEPAINLLIDHGYLRLRAEAQAPGPGRRPSPVYDVNPALLSQNAHNAQNSDDSSDSADSADCAWTADILDDEEPCWDEASFPEATWQIAAAERRPPVETGGRLARSAT